MLKSSYLIIALILILIPLYPKFPLLGVTGTFVAVRLEDIVIAVILGIYGINLLFARFRPLGKPIPRAICLYWCIGFVAVFSGIFLTKTATISLGLLHLFRRVEYMSLFLVAYDWLKNRDQLSFLIKTLLLVSFLVAVYGLGQQFLHFPVISTTNSEFSKGLALGLGSGARINSTFGGSYDLAAFSVFPLLLIIALIPISQKRWLMVTIGGLVYWAMLLSASRVTFFSFFISASLLLVLIRKKIWIVLLVIVSIIGVLISPQLKGRYLEFLNNHLRISFVSSVLAQTATGSSKAVDTVPDALQAPLVAEDRSFNIRLQVEWPKAIRSFIKNPLLGTGFSSVGLAVDNEYLRMLAETGLLGFLAFMLIFVRFFKTSIPVVFHYNPSMESAFITATTCSILSLLISAVFIDYFAASKIALITWTLVGLAEKTKTLKT